jgi:gliding motility-associated-like protein
MDSAKNNKIVGRLLLVLATLSVPHLSVGQSAGGVLSGSASVCQGSNNGVLTVSSYSGAITRWEYSNGSAGPWSTMSFSSASYNFINLQQTTYFRVIVQLQGYPEATSNVAAVICSPPPVAGTVVSATAHCLNSPAGFTLTGASGSVTAWEYSTNNWITTNTLTTSNTLTATLASLTVNTQVRARVQAGSCSAAYSNTVSVNPDLPSVAGSIAGSQSVCAGSSISISVSGQTGAVQYWESSLAQGGPFSTLNGTAGNSGLTVSSLALSIWYRVTVRNGSCPAANSSEYKISVDAPSAGGTAFGTQSVCAGINSGTVMLIGKTGYVNMWQYSDNAGGSWNNISTTLSYISFSNLLSSRLYRAVVQNGICPPAISSSFAVNALASPSASFTANNGCRQTAISFTNQSTGGGVCSWDFGDGGSSAAVHPAHTFFSAGTFSVKLMVTSTAGCIDSIKKQVNVNALPAVSMFSPDSACFGSPVAFAGFSSVLSGSISQSAFRFGDGSQPVQSSQASHSFPANGTFNVTHIAVTSAGCRDSMVKPITILPKPNAGFVASNACRGNVVNFSNNSSIASGIVSHSWSFGNGANSQQVSPVYTYTSPGQFIVSLVSSSEHNCSDTAQKTVLIHDQPVISFTAGESCAGTPVVFTLSLVPFVPGFTVQFGDGSTTNSLNPIHSYPLPGNFQPIVTAVTDSGCVATASLNVRIHPIPIAMFSAEEVCDGAPVQFSNLSLLQNGSLSHSWDFSGQGASALHSPAFTFQGPGSYFVKLTVTSNQGCSDSVLRLVNVLATPCVDFTFTPACDSEPIGFINLSKSSPLPTFVWDFGDQTGSGAQNPVKQYLNPGDYTVSLRCVTTSGCIDSTSRTVSVFESPVAAFEASDFCLYQPVTVINRSSAGSSPFHSVWNFGDGATASEHEPAHLYAAPGSYKTWLMVSTANGCKDSVARFVEVFPLPEIDAGLDTLVEKGSRLQLRASGGLHYSWLPADGLDDPLVFAPAFYANADVSYSVIGTDAHGCSAMDSVRITVGNEFRVTPYNVLTPDGNGLNESFKFTNLTAYPENHLIIFDKWNQEVYSKNGYQNEWDGRNQAGDLLPDGTYYYILTFKDNPKKYIGHITLLRNEK